MSSQQAAAGWLDKGKRGEKEFESDEQSKL